MIIISIDFINNFIIFTFVGEEELAAERNALNINFTNKYLTENEILAQAWIFFVAGYETTATTLSFCSYELAVNPECQEKLYEEVSSAIDSKGEISYETLAKLHYLDSVISETLRLYPPVIRLEREAMTDHKLGDTGITLFKGQIVEIPTYAVHHSEEYYPNPEKFIPERFMPENRHQIIPYTFIPFGAGPRNCVGMRFALMEAKLALAQIVRKFKFVRSAKTEVPLKFKTVTPLCAAKSIIVGIEKR